jgi:UDP-N-acetylglucosamine diphosphorylase/glucosamine-1-phosphate N-acetyltransferase
MTLFLFDDVQARSWEPFVLTRPVGELLFGCVLLRQRAERAWRLPCAGHVAGPSLAGFEEDGAPPVVELPQDRSALRILVNSRAVLTPATLPGPDVGATLLTDGGVAGWVLPVGAPSPPPSALDDPAAWADAPPPTQVGGFLLTTPWELVDRNGARIRDDAATSELHEASPSEVTRMGDGRVLLGPDAAIESGVVVDARDGPVILDGSARAEGPARIVGPLYVGRESVVLGGTVARSSIGRRCLVRGEVADSVLTGFCNKAHDGYLGHALLGRWINLGALTTNSDLKNTYGRVRVELSTGLVDTERLKIGCFLGDYVRTGIGTLLNTGAVVGAGSNLFSGQMPPKYVPPFSWGAGVELTEHRLERFLETARRMQERRGQLLTESMAAMLATAWSGSAELRKSRGVRP